jgi:hypothetical protein
MFCQYGSYQHRAFETSFTLSREAVRNSAQQTWAIRDTVRIQGLMTSQKSTEALRKADIKSRLATLEAAYLYDGGNFYLKYANGQVHYALLSAGCVGGTRVVQRPSFPKGTGVEVVNLRTYTVVIEGIIPVNDSSALESFEESIDIRPYGMKRAVIETLVGPPVEQIVRQQQKWSAVQHGRAVGKYARPPVPPPIWPSALLNQFNPPQDGHPKRIGNALIDWPVSWRYEFENVTPLTGTPNVWGRSYNL